MPVPILVRPTLPPLPALFSITPAKLPPLALPLPIVSTEVPLPELRTTPPLPLKLPTCWLVLFRSSVPPLRVSAAVVAPSVPVPDQERHGSVKNESAKRDNRCQ